MDAFWFVITSVGDLHFWIAVFLAIAGYVAVVRPNMNVRTRRALLVFGLAFLAVALSVEIAKVAVDAPRICTPCLSSSDCNPYCPANDPYGFPSGHTALTFGAFTTAWLVFSTAKKRWKWTWVFTLPVLVGASRLALGVHTPDQVLAGAVLGIVVSTVAWRFAKTRFLRQA